MTLAATVATVARHASERIAVVADDHKMTYGELAEAMARIAGGLATTYRLGAGARVALFMENNATFYPLLMGIWHAGLSAVPINAKLHARELHWIVENSGAKVLIVSAKTAAAVADVTDVSWPPIIVVGSREHNALLASDPVMRAERTTTDEAWLFYTSGTTGRPKGAMLSHRSLLFMCHAYYADIDFLGPGDTHLHAAPLTHGSGLYGLACLLRGGCNVVLPRFEPAEIFDCIERYPNVSMFAAPTMVTRLITHPTAGARDLTNLKTITYGGAPMYVADLKRALALFGPRMYQLFGQGESPMTIAGLSQAMHAETDHPRYEARLASTGVARTGVEMKIVRADGSDADLDEVGEIVTRSDCLMSGYWANPEATESVFRDGWLWTGDMGAIDAEGFLTIKDRSKDMIISGGTNIYPREIEEVLLTHQGVRECAVTGRPHPDWGEEVVAFVVRAEGSDVDENTLDGLCLANIARFKRPKAYVFLDALPKNNYGKVLKTELRQRRG